MPDRTVIRVPHHALPPAAPHTAHSLPRRPDLHSVQPGDNNPAVTALYDIHFSGTTFTLAGMSWFALHPSPPARLAPPAPLMTCCSWISSQRATTPACYHPFDLHLYLLSTCTGLTEQLPLSTLEHTYWSRLTLNICTQILKLLYTQVTPRAHAYKHPRTPSNMGIPTHTLEIDFGICFVSLGVAQVDIYLHLSVSLKSYAKQRNSGIVT